jgi:hypothetical protein
MTSAADRAAWRTRIVYTPVEFRPVAQRIAPASAIVGAPPEAGDTWQTIDFEGAVYGQAGLAAFESRLAVAAWRSIDGAPTTARLRVPPEDLRAVAVARFEPPLKAWVLIDLLDRDRLAAWLAPEDVPPRGGSREIKTRAAGLGWNALPQADLTQAMAQPAGDAQVDAIVSALYRRHKDAPDA